MMTVIMLVLALIALVATRKLEAKEAYRRGCHKSRRNPISTSVYDLRTGRLDYTHHANGQSLFWTAVDMYYHSLDLGDAISDEMEAASGINWVMRGAQIAPSAGPSYTASYIPGDPMEAWWLA